VIASFYVFIWTGSIFYFFDRINLILFFIFSFRLPATTPAMQARRCGRVASRHVRHRLRLRQCRAGSDEAGGDETENKRNPDYPVNPV